MSVVPLCTVRGCGAPLERGERVWRCPGGHAFDVARSGYVNLLQPGDTRSRAAGDAREAVLARDRLEARGLAEPLLRAVEDAVRALAPPAAAAVLDVGACTGRLVDRVAGACGLAGWALDLSVFAADLGARRRPGLSWVVANADRRLPFADGAFRVLVSSAGPKNPAEFRRVLAPGGALLCVVPAPDDLIELRAALLGEGRPLERSGPAIERFGEHFACAGRTLARFRARLDRASLEDVLAAAYRGARRGERERLERLDALEVTLAAEVLELRPRATGSG
jgi:23S rRNA (guanine745-N1)-methyltransferase